MINRRRFALHAGMVVLSAAALGVGSLAMGAQSSTESAAQLLPQRIRNSGVLTVATDPRFPPNTYYDTDGKTIIGINPELSAALAKVLGLKLKLVPTGFAALIPGLQSGKYDMAMSGISDTAAREGKVDFIDYANNGQSFIVPAGNPLKIQKPGDMCGKSLALAEGTISVTIAKAQSEKCVSEGKPAAKILLFPSAAQAILQIQTGRADANIANHNKGVYIAEQAHGKLEVTDFIFDSAYEGIAVNKGQPQLVEALRTALADVWKNGEYMTIMKKYHTEASAIAAPVVNGTTTAKH